MLHTSFVHPIVTSLQVSKATAYKFVVWLTRPGNRSFWKGQTTDCLSSISTHKGQGYVIIDPFQIRINGLHRSTATSSDHQRFFSISLSVNLSSALSVEYLPSSKLQTLPDLSIIIQSSKLYILKGLKHCLNVSVVPPISFRVMNSLSRFISQSGRYF